MTTATKVAPTGAPTRLTLVIPGEPVGKERPRMPKITAAMIGKVVRPYTPQKTRSYEERVSRIARSAVKQQRWAWSTDDRFHVIVKIFRTHVDKGADIDNVFKTVDALNRIAWRDDAHVWGVGIALQRRDRANPRLEIEIRRIHKSVLLGENEC